MKNSFKVSLLASLLVTISACTGVPLEPDFKSYRDSTTSELDAMYRETPESRSVIVGSEMAAQIAGCHYLQRYQVRTQVDFVSSLNLLKYRAYMMGAKRVSIIKHEEINGKEPRIRVEDGDSSYFLAGTSLTGAAYHTSIVAALYDCPVKPS